MSNEKTYSPNWGGYRVGAGRPKVYNGEKRTPHSIYCDSFEIDALKILLMHMREYRDHLNREPVAGHEDAYKGTYEEWEQEYNYLKSICFDGVFAEVAAMNREKQS